MPDYAQAFDGTKLYCLVTKARYTGVNNLPKVVVFDSTTRTRTHDHVILFEIKCLQYAN